MTIAANESHGDIGRELGTLEYRSSVEKWKLFEQQLQPLKDALLSEGVAV